jgi:hypothetical protein
MPAERIGISALIYTSPSYTEDAPRSCRTPPCSLGRSDESGWSSRQRASNRRAPHTVLSGSGEQDAGLSRWLLRRHLRSEGAVQPMAQAPRLLDRHSDRRGIRLRCARP